MQPCRRTHAIDKRFPPHHDQRRTTISGVLSSAVFGLGHYADPGLPGAEQATIFGLVFGTIYAATSRIWMLMIAHAAFDLTALTIIYWNLEPRWPTSSSASP